MSRLSGFVASFKLYMRKINFMFAGIFLLFSGHNTRAVIALCRFFDKYNLPFVIVASSHLDPIFKTDWSSYIIFCRLDKKLDLRLFQQVKAAAENTIGADHKLIYCPTTEFMNQFVLGCREELDLVGIRIQLPSAELYHRLTDKIVSSNLVESISGLLSPPNLEWNNLTAPCVFKPKENIVGGEVLYPVLCFTELEVKQAASELSPDRWFVQRYVSGQSHYLCGYLCRDGQRAWYWQTNLLQQPGGKSIVLAKMGLNPGIDEENLFSGLTRVGYFGPFMMEVIQDNAGGLNYIEINPRFWGPLQLAVDAYPAVLELFAEDMGWKVTNLKIPDDHTCWYAWAKGARTPDCKKYPEAGSIDTDELNRLLKIHDVYGHEDTKLLQGVY